MAEPAMSNFILMMAFEGLREYPPVSKVSPLPTKAMCLSFLPLD